MQAHKCVEFDTPLSPERVVEALLDFSADRPQTWHGLDPKKYKVVERGESSAVVREGNIHPGIWATERYDWSTPGTVEWKTAESNTFAPGSGIRVKVSEGEAGSSHIEVEGTRIAAPTALGYAVVGALKVMGRQYLLSNYKGTFDRLARVGK